MNSFTAFCLFLVIAINGDEFARRLLQIDACATVRCEACKECVVTKKGAKCKSIRGCCSSDSDCGGRKPFCVNSECSKKKPCAESCGRRAGSCSSGLSCVDKCCQPCPSFQCPPFDVCEPCGTMPHGTSCQTKNTLSNGCPGCPILTGCPVGSCKVCGGFAGIQCDAGYSCEDNPNDGCDPANGGADCSGCCQLSDPDPCPVPSCLNPCSGKCSDSEECITHEFFNPNTGCIGCPQFIECVPKNTGTCPPPGIGTCVEACPATGCTNGQLCCSNGCGHACMDPIVTSESLLMHIGDSYGFGGKLDDSMVAMGGFILILILGFVLKKYCGSNGNKLSNEQSPLLVNMQTKC